MKSALLLVTLCALAPASQASSSGSGALEQVVGALQTALNEHRYDAISAHLDPEFAFSGYGGQTGRSVLRQVVAGYSRTIESFELTELPLLDGQRRAQVVLHLDGDEAEKHELLFSDQGLLLRADVVQIQMGHDEPKRAQAARETDDSTPDRLIFPFELADRLIVVDAEVSGVQGRFIVDTGAPAALTLNSSRFPELAAAGTAIEKTPHGVNGSIRGAVEAEVASFRWQQLELEKVSSVLLDLDHLAEATQIDNLAGLIGYELLEPFLVEFDYKNRILTLSKLGPDGNPVGRIAAADYTISAEMMFHLPVVEVELGGQPLRLLIDSGAEQGMLQTRWEEPLGGRFTDLGQTEMTGADKSIQIGSQGRFEELSVGDLDYGSMIFRFNDVQFDHEVIIDGILGQAFLSRYRTALNLRKGEVLVWKS